MAGITPPMPREDETCQSEWLEELADVDCDWDSISLPSTPSRAKPAVSISTKGTTNLPHSLIHASSSSTGDASFTCAADDYIRNDAAAVTDARPASSSSTADMASPTYTSSPPVPKRIIRATFPSAVKPNSPIPGLSPSVLLRTCFCLGEALNVGCQAFRSNQNVLLELYCRVTSSRRVNDIQHFTLADLTHDNPPFVDATFAAWKGVPLWDDDARVFLDAAEGKVARCLGRIERKGSKWVYVLVSIWQASPEDVDYVAGICT